MQWAILCLIKLIDTCFRIVINHRIISILDYSYDMVCFSLHFTIHFLKIGNGKVGYTYIMQL